MFAEKEDWGCREVSKCIGMSRQWVSMAAGSGILPAYRLHERGRFHFKKSEILAWKARCQMQRIPSKGRLTPLRQLKQVTP